MLFPFAFVPNFRLHPGTISAALDNASTGVIVQWDVHSFPFHWQNGV